jgi:hypothetical protein
VEEEEEESVVAVAVVVSLTVTGSLSNRVNECMSGATVSNKLNKLSDDSETARDSE